LFVVASRARLILGVFESFLDSEDRLLEGDIEIEVDVLPYFRFPELFAILVEVIVLMEIFIFLLLHSGLLSLLVLELRLGTASALFLLFFVLSKLGLIVSLFVVVVVHNVLVGLDLDSVLLW
jgi:hypothetical protein